MIVTQRFARRPDGDAGTYVRAATLFEVRADPIVRGWDKYLLQGEAVQTGSTAGLSRWGHDFHIRQAELSEPRGKEAPVGEEARLCIETPHHNAASAVWMERLGLVLGCYLLRVAVNHSIARGRRQAGSE